MEGFLIMLGAIIGDISLGELVLFTVLAVSPAVFVSRHYRVAEPNAPASIRFGMIGLMAIIFPAAVFCLAALFHASAISVAFGGAPIPHSSAGEQWELAQAMFSRFAAEKGWWYLAQWAIAGASGLLAVVYLARAANRTPVPSWWKLLLLGLASATLFVLLGFSYWLTDVR